MAIDPTSRGFGYAVLEGATRLIDWGTKDTRRADSAAALDQATALVEHYRPDALIVEDTSHRDSRRRDRAQELILSVCADAGSHGIAQARIPRRHVLELFAGNQSVNKRAVVIAISAHFPELGPRVPPIRKAWMSEDTRTSIFDAVGFALVFYLQSDSELVQNTPKIPGGRDR
ncbi:MAG TPA: hypothetical protein VFV19_18755 [Candidatus Polarisedimenticolaceae bacterium]|nr:hypothetical protein [Candidatus Polarisedimenticolaceae bacterium]